MTAVFEKYAQALATAAVTGQRADLEATTRPFVKAANPGIGAALQTALKDPTTQRYLLGGVGGLGLGALVGAMQPNRKRRNALNYGLMGGLGGLGMAHLMGYAGGSGGTPPVGQQTANETIAAARAAGMSPYEYLKNRREPDADAAYNAELMSQLSRDGGLLDRFGGAGLLESARRAVRSGYNRTFGTRDAGGKLVPPRPILDPNRRGTELRNIVGSRRAAVGTSNAVQANQTAAADTALATARKTIGDAQTTLRSDTGTALEDIRRQLQADRASASRSYSQALDQRPGAGYGGKPGQTDFSSFKPSPALTGPLAELDPDYQARRRATRAATDAAKVKVRELATSHRAGMADLSQQLQVGTEQHDLARLQAEHRAGRDIQNARSNAQRQARRPSLGTIGRNPVARALGAAINFAPAVYGAYQGASGLMGGLGTTK